MSCISADMCVKCVWCLWAVDTQFVDFVEQIEFIFHSVAKVSFFLVYQQFSRDCRVSHHHQVKSVFSGEFQHTQ